MSVIEVSVDGEPKAVVPLTGAVLSIGRNSECDIHLPDPKVSGLHALISKQGRHFFIEDAASTNGLEINGEPRQFSTKLHLGDEISIIKRYVLTVVKSD